MPKLFFRTAILEPETDVAKTGTVRLSFASEQPVLRSDKKRGKYWEKLSHAPGDANLATLNRKGILLQNHDENLEIGEVVKDSAKVEADKKTRASITISDANWKTRVAGGDMPGVSVGYVQLSVLREEPEKIEGHPVLVFAWQPYEISLLTGEPADRSVGINRAKQKRMVKRRCADCEGTGRCRCRKKPEDDADSECENCDGDGDCPDCDGDGYIETARGSVDSLENTNAETILAKLNSEQKTAMRILLDPKPEGGGAATLTREQDRKRISEISTLANTYAAKHGDRVTSDGKKLRDLVTTFAREAIEADTSVDTFKARCWDAVQTTVEKPDTSIASIVDRNDKDRPYSMLRAIQSCITNDSRTPKGDTFEGGIHTEIVKRWRASEIPDGGGGGAGFAYKGFQVPRDAPVEVTRKVAQQMQRDMQSQVRDMQVSIFGQGGALVPTILVVPVIELLRNRLILDWAGVRVMSGLSGNVAIPRQTAPATAYSVAEIAALTASQQTLDQILLNPRRVGATEYYGKQLLFQSTPDVESLIRDDLFKQIALLWDYYGLSGQGSASQPLGIFNQPGVSAITFGGTPTYIQMIKMETNIRSQNVMGPLSYISTSATKGDLKGVAEALTGATTIGGSQNAIWKGQGAAEGMVNGWPAMDSQQVQNNQVVCGDFEEAILGLWGGLDVVVEPYTKAANAEWAITINTWGDYAVRHPQAFCCSTDAGNQ